MTAVGFLFTKVSVKSTGVEVGCSPPLQTLTAPAPRVFSGSEFSSWTELFENDMMVSALVDRLTYRSHVLDMNIPDGGRFSLDLKGKGEQRR